MAKVLPIFNPGPFTHLFNCPGCNQSHGIDTKRWYYNEDEDRPTVTPSILVRGYDEVHRENFVCHSFITNGNIQFLSDCTHDLAGQTVPLEDV